MNKNFKRVPFFGVLLCTSLLSELFIWVALRIWAMCCQGAGSSLCGKGLHHVRRTPPARCRLVPLCFHSLDITFVIVSNVGKDGEDR